MTSFDREMILAMAEMLEAIGYDMPNPTTRIMHRTIVLSGMIGQYDVIIKNQKKAEEQILKDMVR